MSAALASGVSGVPRRLHLVPQEFHRPSHGAATRKPAKVLPQSPYGIGFQILRAQFLKLRPGLESEILMIFESLVFAVMMVSKAKAATFRFAHFVHRLVEVRFDVADRREPAKRRFSPEGGAELLQLPNPREASGSNSSTARMKAARMSMATASMPERLSSGSLGFGGRFKSGLSRPGKCDIPNWFDFDAPFDFQSLIGLGSQSQIFLE
ncbi:MAG: hypothetical protein JWM59_1908 [Verrucomicrobiales bacterium]|nr:hypothetical protein [Verrucomicrobiales bacterium]